MLKKLLKMAAFLGLEEIWRIRIEHGEARIAVGWQVRTNVHTLIIHHAAAITQSGIIWAGSVRDKVLRRTVCEGSTCFSKRPEPIPNRRARFAMSARTRRPREAKKSATSVFADPNNRNGGYVPI